MTQENVKQEISEKKTTELAVASAFIEDANVGLENIN